MFYIITQADTKAIINGIRYILLSVAFIISRIISPMKKIGMAVHTGEIGNNHIPTKITRKMPVANATTFLFSGASSQANTVRAERIKVPQKTQSLLFSSWLVQKNNTMAAT